MILQNKNFFSVFYEIRDFEIPQEFDVFIRERLNQNKDARDRGKKVINVIFETLKLLWMNLWLQKTTAQKINLLQNNVFFK